MNSTLKILGLGRCAVGLLRKRTLNIRESNFTPNQKIQFDHHYILNPFSCIQSNISDVAKQALAHNQCTPTLPDQLHCLDRIEEYQVCAIEIFPPSKLYLHKAYKIFACFESFTKELQKNGFTPVTHNYPEHANHLDPEVYIRNLANLIKSIKERNKSISIVLLNGELLYDQAGKQLSSPLLHKIMDKVKNRGLQFFEDITLLDINDNLLELSKKHRGFFETEFPLLYIRHQPDLQPIEVARDCKHASPTLRQDFAFSFYNFLTELGYSLPKSGKYIQAKESLPYDYRHRADEFLTNHNKKNKIKDNHLEFLFQDSRKLSQYVEYVLSTQNIEGHLNLKKYIIGQSFFNGKGQDLVSYLYHIRTLSAYLFTTKHPLLPSLCLIGMGVLALPKATHEQYLTYVLLWLKNICLAAKEIIIFNNIFSAQSFIDLLEELKEKDYLHNHEIIRQLITLEETCI